MHGHIFQETDINALVSAENLAETVPSSGGNKANHDTRTIVSITRLT